MLLTTSLCVHFYVQFALLQRACCTLLLPTPIRTAVLLCCLQISIFLASFFYDNWYLLVDPLAVRMAPICKSENHYRLGSLVCFASVPFLTRVRPMHVFCHYVHTGGVHFPHLHSWSSHSSSAHRGSSLSSFPHRGGVHFPHLHTEGEFTILICTFLVCTQVEFREDLKGLYKQAGVANKPSVFLFDETQIVHESFLEDVNNILSSGEVRVCGSMCVCACAGVCVPTCV